MQKHIFYSISYQAWNKTKAVFAKAWLALAHWEVTGFDASLRQSNTPQDHNRPHPAPKEIPQKESSPIENAMQAFSDDFAIFIYLMAHTEGLVREISKEVLSQDCSYGKKLLFKACFLKHNSFKNFTCPYLTDIHFLFSQTSFASVSPRRNETRKNYSVTENWTWRPKFSGISMNFISLLSVSRAGEACVPGDSWTYHHTNCSLPPPHAQKRALSGLHQQSQVMVLHLLEHLALPHLALRKPSYSALHPPPSYL